MNYPIHTFKSEKEYKSYLSCIRKLSPGDKIYYRWNNIEKEAIFIHKDLSYYFNSFDLIIGSYDGNDPLFHTPKTTQRVLIVKAKKSCPEIISSKIRTICVNCVSFQIKKIIKYNAEKEKEKKESKKRLRSRRKNEK